MKSKENSYPTNLSPDVANASRRRGIRKCVKDIVKSVLFWAVALTILFVTESQNDLFTRHSQPFWFSIILIFLVAFPILKWKPYRLLLERKFHGTLVTYRNKRSVESSDHDVRGIFFDRGRMRTVDVYIIKVQDPQGHKRTFTIKGANTEFARAYYQKGDILSCPRFANLPFNESRPLPRPLCLWCGSIGSPNETVCISCNAPYALVPEDDEFHPQEGTMILPEDKHYEA